MPIVATIRFFTTHLSETVPEIFLATGVYRQGKCPHYIPDLSPLKRSNLRGTAMRRRVSGTRQTSRDRPFERQVQGVRRH